jgi:flavin reductase (DIM6/NTAB) family NADH-FMN oxidoreductase RutF
MKKSLGPQAMAYPTPVWCVGSYDDQNRANVMTAAWGGISCSKPPCISVSLRKATYTYGSIMKRKAFTVSIPSEKYVKEADYFGMASGRDVDKFEKTGLSPVKSNMVDAPYVKEFPLVLECKLIHFHEIGLHTYFVGEIVDIKADEEVLKDGRPDLEKIRPIIFGPEIRTYHGVGRLIGLAFESGKAFLQPRQ